MNFLSVDGPFIKFMTLLADIIMLSIIYLLLCIPIITIGPATTALYYVMTKRIYEKESYIFKDFFKSFGQNFKQSMLTYIVLSVMTMVVLFNMYMVLNKIILADNIILGQIMMMVYFLILFELVIISIYVYPVISRFHLSFTQGLKTALVLSNKHLPTTIGIVLIHLTVMFLTYIMPVLMFASAGIISAFSSFFFMTIFKKYIPTMDQYESEISYDAISGKDK